MHHHVADYYLARMRTEDARLSRMSAHAQAGNLGAPYRVRARYFADCHLREVVREVSPETLPLLPVPRKPY